MMQTHENHFPMLLASKTSQAIPLRSRHIRSVRAHIFSCGERAALQRSATDSSRTLLLLYVLVFLQKSWTYMEQHNGKDIEALSEKLIRPRRRII
jgi:hypothetical protein